MGTYQIIGSINNVAYYVALLPSLSILHDVFHVSQLMRFILDSFQSILLETVELEVELSFKPHPRQVMDHVTKVSRNKEIPLVKFFWKDCTRAKLLGRIFRDVRSLSLYI